MKERPRQPSEHAKGQVWTQTFICNFKFSTTDLASNPLCSPGTWNKMITTLCGFLGRGCRTTSMLDAGTQSLHYHFTGVLGTSEIG